jgi:hypothetical protein
MGTDKHPPDAGLGYYQRPGVMTWAGEHAGRLDGLPADVGGLAEVTQGILIHEHLARLYDFKLPDERRDSVHLRPAELLLERIISEDARPLSVARPASARVAGNCRHFTVLLVTLLRAQGTPARARCGFGGYFGPGTFEDHWVCEYWAAGQQRWVLADAQLDARQRDFFTIGFDVLDVPRDQFLVAGDAWARYRAGTADPGNFGLTLLHESGAWWIASNLIRDVAALCGMEMLPWDVWGAMPGPADVIGPDLTALLDELAALTADPDASLAELRARYAADERLRVPAVVRNAIRGTTELV